MKKIFAFALVVLMLLSACAEKEQTADYSDCFDGVNGCAVFYDFKEEKYIFYDEAKCNTSYSPNSTFKIIATLEGLKYGVVTSENSKMHYNGQIYPFESWNSDLNLKQAFQNSCVWYYRQLIDGVGQQNIAEDLRKIGYGNCDVSEWNGTGEAPTEDTNGFWLGSSLEISPVETVNVLADVFEGKTDYNEEHIIILKDIMKSDVPNVYGKTGTGRDNSAWYAGFIEKDSGNIYFAVHLQNDDGKAVAGADAKKILLNIVDRYY